MHRKIATMKRTIIKIDEQLCNGCGACVSGCHEGALQLINGKAVMVSELYCDGLGACIGECPVGAIELEEREAEPYSEVAVMERLVEKGEKVLVAHLKHLKEHGELELLKQGLDYLKQHNIRINVEVVDKPQEKMACGCPGSVAKTFTAAPTSSNGGFAVNRQSELRHFPVQLHLVNPQSGVFEGSDLLLAADCCAFAHSDFHSKLLKNKTLAIACPKLDSNTQSYVAKLTRMIDDAQINTLTVAIMEVPCCGGLRQIAELARKNASRSIPIKIIVLSVQGAVKSESWI